MTSLALKMPKVRRDHTIDYLGAATIVAAVTSILLFTAWAGPAYGWTDPFSLLLLSGGVLLSGLFLFVEFRAEEPIIPLRLFHNRVFTPTVIFTAIMGMAMFGGIIFLPVYLQVVQGMSPTESGLALLPMVAGLFTTSISSGQLVTRTGRYRIYLILGAAVTGVGIALLDAGRRHAVLADRDLLLRLRSRARVHHADRRDGVQNAVERRDMGSATSSVTFFRSMGAAFGTAIFGAVPPPGSDTTSPSQVPVASRRRLTSHRSPTTSRPSRRCRPT